MRLEFNPRELCYNLYCDTAEERKKMKQMMEKPLVATDLKEIDNMIYACTDSIYKMNREYITVIVDSKPVVIFKDKIVAVEKDASNKAYIYTCTDSIEFHTSNNYADVIKQFI